MSILICVPGLPNQEWKIGDPVPKLSGACTKFYAGGAELLAINAVMALLSERPVQPLPPPGVMRTPDELLAERESIAPMCLPEFSERVMAQNICHTLTWCLGTDCAPPSALFGWITMSMPKIMEAMEGESMNADNLLRKIGEMQQTQEVLQRLENESESGV